MPNFENDFINSRGNPIKYKDIELIRIDKIPVKKIFSGYIRIISINSEWRQGIKLRADGFLKINSIKGNNFIIWSENVKESVFFEGTSKNLQLIVWNAWDSGNCATDSLHNGAAMILEVDKNIRRYKCNDGHPDENFDDIIFEVEINE